MEGPQAYATQGRPVRLPFEVAVQVEEPSVRQVRRHGPLAYAQWSRLVALEPVVCLAARPAPAAELAYLRRLPSGRQRLRLPDRLELRVGFQAPGAAAAAAPGYEPAAQPEHLDRAE